MPSSHGVVFPVSSAARPGGEEARSTSAFAREVVATALDPIDAVGARAARSETNWRKGYAVHLRRLVEASADRPEAAVAGARAGLSAVSSGMRWKWHEQAADEPLDAAFGAPAGGCELDGTAEVRGEEAPDRELSVPFAGGRLRGQELHDRLEDWVGRGIIEHGVRDAVVDVMRHPDWLSLPGRTVAVLGASAEMGPLRSLLRWGATVAAVDLPRPALWDGLRELASCGAGRLLVPTGSDRTAGADLLHQVGAVGRWLESLDGDLVLGNYVYADGATNLRLSAATDALAVRLMESRPEASLAYLATPTDVFVVPDAAVAGSVAAYGDPTIWKKIRGPLRAASGGRLLRRQYAPGVTPAISDSVVLQQGPNYLLAKRIHRWRAMVAAADGRVVSMNIAPPTRTVSVTKNRALAAAYAGAHRFGVEIFAPATSNTLMAALLVHDLMTGGRVAAQGFPRSEQTQAAHGGLWRTPYAPRSALGIAALLGVGASRA